MINFTDGMTGTFKVVSMERDLEYMTVGQHYTFRVDQGDVSWKRHDGAGSFSRTMMINIFQQQGRLVLEPIANGWCCVAS